MRCKPFLRVFIAVFLLVLVPVGLLAITVPEENEVNVKEEANENYETTSVDNKRARFTILAGPGYTPEMGFVLGGGFLMSWYTGQDPSTVTRSSMPVMFTVATKGGYSFTIRKKSYWLEDKLRWNTNFILKNMEDNYWGVGYDAGKNTPKGEDTTAYHKFYWVFEPMIMWKFLPNFYAGGLWDVNQTIATEVNPVMENDPYFTATGSDNLNSGPGVVVQYDTRDFPQNAWEGFFLEGKATFYRSWLGSENNYEALSLDYRQYLTLSRKGQVLSWQVYSRGSWGEVPWGELSFVGSTHDLRGYYNGRYRERMVIWAIAEYRHTFLKKDKGLSKHGFVTWAGVGTLGQDYLSLQGVLPNIGIGYRYEVQPRLNVRFDIGWGIDTVGVYFNFQEAF